MALAEEKHRYWMQRCLDLARQGFGHVSPNPMVGALIVYNHQIIGEGYHTAYGGAHAEVQALNSVTDPGLLAHSTLYVNLEPCAHHGKTPPCSDHILEAGIPEVVISSLDPNPQVAGSGVEKLKEGGISVVTGLGEEEAKNLNKRFHIHHRHHTPYVILKWAQSADGFLADENGNSGWISNLYSRILVHQWRAHEDAIMVGSRTAIQDNPRLSARLWQGKNPLRIVLDPELAVAYEANLLDGSITTWVLNRYKSLTYGSIHYHQVDMEEQSWLTWLLNALTQSGYQSLIVEGGGMLLDTFIRHNKWHEARIFIGENYLGGGVTAPVLKGKRKQQAFIGNDLLQYWINA